MPMGIWKRLFGAPEETVDYYREGVELLAAGNYHEALTSLRLALRESPDDVTILQQIAVAQTRIGMTSEAYKSYRQALERDPKASGAHYGLAFLLLHEGRHAEAAEHLKAFLESPPTGPDVDRHIMHARRTLSELQAAAEAGGEMS